MAHSFAKRSRAKAQERWELATLGDRTNNILKMFSVWRSV